MKIALVQQRAGPDKEENLERGLRALERAAAAGAELAVFPELSFTPFLPRRPAAAESLAHAEPVPGPTTDRVREAAGRLGIVAVFNLLERDGERTYDTSPVIDADGALVGRNRMVHVIEAPGFHEKGFYAPGDLGAGVFPTAAGRIGIAVCYDRHFPEYMRALALKGAELVVVPQLQVAAFQNGYFAALCNRVGPEEELLFAGESFVTGPDGRVLARAPALEDHLLFCDVDLRAVEACAAKRHFLPDRRPEVYGKL